MAADGLVDGSDNEEQAETFENWGDDETATTKCLFTDRVFSSVSDCLFHARESYGLDLMQVARTLRLDTYGCISLVNFIRRSMAAPDANAEAVAQAIAGCDVSAPQSWPWRDEMYLTPALPDDPLLYSLAMGMDGDDDEPLESDAPATEHAREMMAEMRAMQAQMAEVLGGIFGDEVAGRATADGHPQASGEAAGSTSAVCASTGLATSAGSSGSSLVPPGQPRPAAPILGSPVGPSGKRVDAAEDSSYFASYARLGIHEEMLADQIRTDGYRQAIEGNTALLQGKVVLDVGCGSGILSMFAARAGARLAIGVDASDIIGPARAVVKLNGLSDIVQLYHSTLEEFVLPAPLDKVDVIISEWMGYALLYESMLPTLLTARDRFLAPGGAILPSATSLLLAGSSHDRLAFFSDVYGFNYAPFVEPNRAEASVEIIPPETLLTPSTVFRTFDMLAVTNDDLDFTAPFTLTATGAGMLRSLIVHFDTEFDLTPQGGKASRFRTAPESPPTHWKQTALYLRRPRELGPGDVVNGQISFSRNRTYERGYDFAVTVQVNDGASDTQLFGMN